MTSQKALNFVGFTALLAAFYAASLAIMSLASLSMSPGVLGSILLLIALLIFPKMRAKYYPSSQVLFGHFPLFVVPAGVGIMTSVVYFIDHPLLVLWVIFGSTLLSIIFTAFIVRLLIGKHHD